MIEEWRVVGIRDDYEISNLGRLRFVPPGGAPRIVKPYVTRQGYHKVSFKVDGRQRFFQAHRLVAAAFLGPSELHVLHGDGDPGNNSVANLRYGTDADNMADTLRHGTHRWASLTHCSRGHEFTPENTYIWRGYQRHCRKCRAQREQARRNAS